jgi:hypothetical protein
VTERLTILDVGLRQALRRGGVLLLVFLVVAAAFLLVNHPPTTLRMSDINSSACPEPRYDGIHFNGRRWVPAGMATWRSDATHVSGTLKVLSSNRAVFVADIGGEQPFEAASSTRAPGRTCALT